MDGRAYYKLSDGKLIGVSNRTDRKNPLLASTLYQVDITVSLASWESDRTHERVYKNQIRLNKINKVNFEGV